MASDEELLERLRAGDVAAFRSLVDRYHIRLVGLARSVLGRQELAEEVAQETWIAVLQGAERFEGRSALRTWLFRICVNKARSTGAREHRSTPVAPDGPSVDATRFDSNGVWVTPPEDWSDSVDDRIVAGGLIGLARQAIEELPDLQRSVVTLRDVEGLPSRDVCRALSISAANERVLLHRGRSRVRAALEAHERGR